MESKESTEQKSERPEFDFEDILAKGMDMQCTKPPPGVKDEFPIKAFVDFESFAKRTFFKN